MIESPIEHNSSPSQISKINEDSNFVKPFNNYYSYHKSSENNIIDGDSLKSQPLYKLNDLLEGHLECDGLLCWYPVIIVKIYSDCSYDVISQYDNKYYYNIKEINLREVEYHEGEYVEYKACTFGYLRGRIQHINNNNTYNLLVDKNEFKGINTRSLRRINNRKKRCNNNIFHENDIIYIKGGNLMKGIILYGYTDKTYDIKLSCDNMIYYSISENMLTKYVK